MDSGRLRRVRDHLQQLERRGLPRPVGYQAVQAALAIGALRDTRTAAMLEETEVDGAVPSSCLYEAVYKFLPEGLVTTAPLHIADSKTTGEVFRTIVAVAQEFLFIISPYIDADGVGRLSDVLTQAARRDVAVRLLTREIEKESPLRAEGIRRLAQVVGPDRLEVRDYYFFEAGRQQTAVHAKMLLADTSLGYVGSAEVRRNALEINFELGYLFHAGAAADAAHRAFETFWARAQPVRA